MKCALQITAASMFRDVIARIRSDIWIRYIEQVRNDVRAEAKEMKD